MFLIRGWPTSRPTATAPKQLSGPINYVICLCVFLSYVFYSIKINFYSIKIKFNKLSLCMLYSGTMMKGHGIYPTGDSHEQRRHSWFSKSRAAPTAPGIRLGLGLGSTFCRGYSGTSFIIRSDSEWTFLYQNRKSTYYYCYKTLILFSTIKHKNHSIASKGRNHWNSTNTKLVYRCHPTDAPR